MSNSNFYKKLARAGWRQGKEYKKQSNVDIRNHKDADENPSFDEIWLEMRGLNCETFIIDEWDDELHSKLLNVKPTLPKKIEKTIKKHLTSIKRATNSASRRNVKVEDISKLVVGGDWLHAHYNSILSDYKKAMSELPKYLEREDLPNKLRKRIEEILHESSRRG